MPKKRHSSQYSKPLSPAHPSLGTSEKHVIHSLATPKTSSNSVSDRLQQLRIEQRSSNNAGSIYEPPPKHTVHPSLRTILQVPDTLPPRPRPGLRTTSGRRAVPGPRPPDSWLKRAPPLRTTAGKSTLGRRSGLQLAGYDPPTRGSLSDLTYKELAKDWDFHIEYDQFYLATLPVRQKEVLLHYISLHSPNGLSGPDLTTLFLDSTLLPDATGASGLSRLDVASSINASLSFQSLKSFFIIPQPTASPSYPVTSAENSESLILESWDESPILQIPPSLPLFHSVTHLSLASPSLHPHPWPPFVHHLLPHLPPILTHLSLAFWPTPTLTPGLQTAYTRAPTGNIQAGGSNYYSAYDEDWTEAASIIRRVARATAALRWLDLTGCGAWLQCLSQADLDLWVGYWGHVEEIHLGQGHIPASLAAGEDEWRRRKGELLNRQNEADRVGGIEQEKERRALCEWACGEWKSLRLEKEIRGLISRSGRVDNDGLDGEGGNAVRGGCGDGWEMETEGCRQRIAKTGTRTTALRFVRDWDEEWIRRAIDEIAVWCGR